MERRIATRGIIYQDGKILAVKHKDEHDNEADFWAIPGGGLDPRETLHDNLTRELIEELGITPTIGKLLFVQQYHDEKREYLEFFFLVTNPQDFTAIDLTSTSHGTLEIARCEFIDPTHEHILPAFLQTINLADYITHDRPVFVYNQLNL